MYATMYATMVGCSIFVIYKILYAMVKFPSTKGTKFTEKTVYK